MSQEQSSTISQSSTSTGAAMGAKSSTYLQLATSESDFEEKIIFTPILVHTNTHNTHGFTIR